MQFTIAVTGTVTVDIPAITRLVDYLEGAQQKQLDSQSAQITALTQKLQPHTTGLQTAIDQEKK